MNDAKEPLSGPESVDDLASHGLITNALEERVGHWQDDVRFEERHTEFCEPSIEIGGADAAPA